MIIPHNELPTETLMALIEEFVTRDGTDYGEQDIAVSTKVEQIMKQLEQKEVFIVYSELHETCNILPKDALSKG